MHWHYLSGNDDIITSRSYNFYTVHDNQTWQDRRKAYLYLPGDYDLIKTR